MADYFPLIVNPAKGQLQELEVGDTLLMTGSNVNVANGNINTTAIYTDNYYYANGAAYISGLGPQGPNNSIQFSANSATKFGGDANLIWDGGNIVALGVKTNNYIIATSFPSRPVAMPYAGGTSRSAGPNFSIQFNKSLDNLISITNITQSAPTTLLVTFSPQVSVPYTAGQNIVLYGITPDAYNSSSPKSYALVSCTTSTATLTKNDSLTYPTYVSGGVIGQVNVVRSSFGGDANLVIDQTGTSINLNGYAYAPGLLNANSIPMGSSVGTAVNLDNFSFVMINAGGTYQLGMSTIASGTTAIATSTAISYVSSKGDTPGFSVSNNQTITNTVSNIILRVGWAMQNIGDMITYTIETNPGSGAEIQYRVTCIMQSTSPVQIGITVERLKY